MSKYFSDTLNVLMNVHRVYEFPYPHAYTYQCLPEEVYKALSDARPTIPDDGRNNARIDMPAAYALEAKELHEIWLDFIEYHTSHSFYRQILRKFGWYFEQFYPELGDMSKYSTAVRYSRDEADIYLDCQIGINTAVKEKSTVNHPHVDNPNELWASLLYMRKPTDYAGGNLVLHKCVKPPKFHGKREADEDTIRESTMIAYQPNTFACFINSPLSIHSVTQREVTDQHRLLVNISLEFDRKPLFHVQ